MQAADWVDRDEYPFPPLGFDVAAGRMHYVDVGRGDAIVFVHGVPTWSFLFRHLIRGLQDRYRCIAMDHLGFGLSDKPADYAYDPADLAGNLARLLDSLSIERAILAVHDWGGPLALPWAIHNPDRVRGLVIFNTWMWPVTGDRRAELLGRAFASRAYARLDERYNATVRLLPRMVGPRARMSPSVYRQYAEPLSSPDKRHGMMALVRAISGASPWLAVQWQQAPLLRAFPAMICWGMRDLAFSETDLSRWRSLFVAPQLHRYESVGHFPPEEAPADVCRAMSAFARSCFAGERPAAGSTA